MTDEIVFVCGECGALVSPVPDPPVEDRCAGGRYVCENGHVAGIWLDAGTLDLGVISPSDKNDDFRIFAESWEKVGPMKIENIE